MDASRLVSGVRRSYKKARQVMRKARRSGSPAFHEWRKRIKTLWYALRLLEYRVPVDPQLTELSSTFARFGDSDSLSPQTKTVGGWDSGAWLSTELSYTPEAEKSQIARWLEHPSTTRARSPPFLPDCRDTAVLSSS